MRRILPMVWLVVVWNGSGDGYATIKNCIYDMNYKENYLWNSAERQMEFPDSVGTTPNDTWLQGWGQFGALGGAWASNRSADHNCYAINPPRDPSSGIVTGVIHDVSGGFITLGNTILIAGGKQNSLLWGYSKTYYDRGHRNSWMNNPWYKSYFYYTPGENSGQVYTDPSRDGATLTPGFDQAPFGGYVDLSYTNLTMIAPSSSSSVNQIFVDYTDYYNIDMKPYFEQLDLGISSVKAYIHFYESANKQNFLIYRLDNITQIDSNHCRFDVGYLMDSSNNSLNFTDGSNYRIQFNQVGNLGNQGYTGYTGFQGFQGYTGYTGFQGFQGYTGFQGFQGYQGFQGFQGYQGDIVNWWNTYDYTFSDISTNSPTIANTKSLRLITDGEFIIDISNAGVTSGDSEKLTEASKISLTLLSDIGIIEKIPRTNGILYKLRMNLTIEMGSDPFDYLELFNFDLKEGDIFDGNYYTITINNSLGLQADGTCETLNTNTTYLGKGQSGLFKIPFYQFFDLSSNGKYYAIHTTRQSYEDAGLYKFATNKHVEMKNFKYTGTAAIRTNNPTQALMLLPQLMKPVLMKY